VITNIGRFDVRASFVLPFDDFGHVFADLIGDIIDVFTTTSGSDTVDE